MPKTPNPRVLIFDASYDESMAQVVEKILDEFPFEWKGRNVLVKPNILSANLPEKGITTHPALVRPLVSKLIQKGANVIVGDNPGIYGYGQSDKAARVSGIKDAAQGCFIHLGRNPVKYAISSRYTEHIMIAKDVLDADIVVNLPKLKTHALTYFTGSVKNTFGYVVGGGKIRAHSQATNPRRFAEILVDIFQVRPPELNIMDAVEAMEGNGPSQGSVRHLGKVLASNNAVSLDAVALHLIGRKVKAVPHLEIAGDRGLGAVDISEISLIGKLTPVTNFKMPATFVPGIVGIVLNRFLSRWINCVPETIKANCKKCGICVNHCPVEAMKMADDFPIADKNKCINCYCCQEMCPEDAIRLTGRVISCIRRS
jgi:uncharacterized protein (DUF362 family)/NAD-dependent dihydropyrimidine dehydrogenase PreA subunit